MHRIIPDKAEDLEINLPSSKSITHRLFILAALNRGITRIENPLLSDDTQLTRSALETMGAVFEEQDKRLIVSKPIGETRGDEIYLGNSGSSARFLIPLGTFLDRPVKFYGSDRLHKRPFVELLQAIQTFGHKFESTNDSLPVRTLPGHSTGGTINFSVLPSSQIVTALMMAGLRMQKNLTIRLPNGMPSLPYIRMTANLMKRLRLNVKYSASIIRVECGEPKMDWTLPVEKDFSAASYWVVYALINGVKVILKNMNVPSLQGDEEILRIAELAGSRVMLYKDRIEITGRISNSLDLNCEDTPDLVPSLSVLALFCKAPSRLRKVKVLEYKESNRIEAIRKNIETIGGHSAYKEGQLTIYPQKQYHGGLINAFNDHRIAMSFAIAGTRIPDIVIDDPECVDKSYPDFWRDFAYWKKSGRTLRRK
jgi:3-phosphoshikimate 1-carboxyvinyltransferase